MTSIKSSIFIYQKIRFCIAFYSSSHEKAAVPSRFLSSVLLSLLNTRRKIADNFLISVTFMILNFSAFAIPKIKRELWQSVYGWHTILRRNICHCSYCCCCCCWIYCTFTLVLPAVCVQCPIWLFSGVPWLHVFPVCCSRIFWVTLK